MNKRLLLLYPELGFTGSFVINVPISLIYAAAKSVNIKGLTVEIIDCRVNPGWREYLNETLKNGDVLMVGISVMSGIPIVGAFEISRIVKGFSNIPVVWGGAHPTIMPEDTLNYEFVDYCIRGYASNSLRELVEFLMQDREEMDSINGLCYKKNGELIIGEIHNEFENFKFRDLPYFLVENNLEKYFSIQNERIFPIYTASGCPYQCSFCISPVWYKDIRKKWVPQEAVDVADHIEHLVREYRIESIYFYDDDTFVKFSHFEGIARELINRNLKVKLGIRGIRVNELKKMKAKDFQLLVDVGVETLHIGLESGSQRMLDLMKKGISVEDSLFVNKEMLKYPKLLPMYNILCGIPTETIDDLKETGKFMLKLSEDNPNCIIFDPGKLIPYPGSEMYELARQNGFEPPTTSEEWRALDQEGDIYFPWYTPEYDRYIKMLQIGSYALSNWEAYLKKYSWSAQLAFKIAKILYKPIAKFRINQGFSGFLFEYALFKTISSRLAD
ncbi:MAG: B12-binding domain-containing radical SAM protein [Nitrospinota bacterium]|nr:B12-binding domain-containing radical SAM protein [Nitrospinota bacterium]